jgi:AIPR protein
VPNNAVQKHQQSSNLDPVIRDLLPGFQQDHGLGGLKESEAFEAFAGYCILSSFYESQFNPDLYRMGGGNDYGIDVFAILINGELMRDEADVRSAIDGSVWVDAEFILVQAKTTPSFESKVIPSLTDYILHLFVADPLIYPASNDVLNIRRCIKAVYQNLKKLYHGRPRLHVRYATSAKDVDSEAAQKAMVAQQQLKQADLFDLVEFKCLTASDLYALRQKAATAVTAEFEMPSRVKAPGMPAGLSSAFGFVSARELVGNVLTDLHGNIRKSLFFENVRDFQGYENEVNRQIRATLRNPGERHRFGALNNGITIVARQMTVTNDRVSMTDFQVVNGCQTCHVLFNEQEHLTDDVHVPIRVVHSTDETVIAGIIAATNRQTAITDDDISSREVFHKSLELFFSTRPEKQRLYYERRSKQYAERRDIEKTRVINRAQLVRAYNALFFGVLPETQSKRDLFRPKDHREPYYAAAVAHYRIESLLRNRRLSPDLRSHRYHLLAAIKWRLLGEERIPQRLSSVAEFTNRIVDVLWDEGSSERLMVELMSRLDAVFTGKTSVDIEGVKRIVLSKR